MISQRTLRAAGMMVVFVLMLTGSKVEGQSHSQTIAGGRMFLISDQQESLIRTSEKLLLVMKTVKDAELREQCLELLDTANEASIYAGYIRVLFVLHVAAECDVDKKKSREIVNAELEFISGGLKILYKQAEHQEERIEVQSLKELAGSVQDFVFQLQLHAKPLADGDGSESP